MPISSFYKSSLKFFSHVSVQLTITYLRFRQWFGTQRKPSPEPMMAQFTGVYIHTYICPQSAFVREINKCHTHTHFDIAVQPNVFLWTRGNVSFLGPWNYNVSGKHHTNQPDITEPQGAFDFCSYATLYLQCHSRLFVPDGSSAQYLPPLSVRL